MASNNEPIDLSKEIALLNEAISAIGKNLTIANMRRVVEQQELRVYHAALKTIASLDTTSASGQTPEQLLQYIKSIAGVVLKNKPDQVDGGDGFVFHIITP